MIEDTRLLLPQARPHPLLRLLVSFPIALFCGALVTDIAYVASTNFLWADFSAWMLAGGFGLGVLAAIVGVVVLLRHRGARPGRANAVMVIGSLLVLGAGFVDNLVHSRDGWTAVFPEGIILSAITVLLIVTTLWLSAAAYGNRVAYRQETVVVRDGRVRP